MDAATHKDVVITALGAAAGLGGLVLVFEGIIITTRQSFPGDTPDDILKSYRRAGQAGFLSFTLSLLSVTAAFLWLLLGGDGWYQTVVVLFLAQLIALVGLAGYVTSKLMA